MLRVQNLYKSFGPQVLFEDISFQMNAGERLSLVGRNGSGKTTLFKIILGQEEPDAGTIVFPKNYRLGYLEQHLNFTKPSLLDEACLGLPAHESEDTYKAKAILFGLGFSEQDLDRAPAEFSGGFQVRLQLAKVLVSKPNLLLLDEPTNYLDIVSLRWLVEFLRAWPDEIIMISHDRDFLDSVATHTAALHRHKLKKMSGDTKKLYDQILLEEEIHESTRINEEKKRKHMEVFINRFRAKATKASVVQSRVKQLEKLPRLEGLSQLETLDFEFRHLPFEAKTLLEVQDLTFGFDPAQPLIKNFNLPIYKNDRIAVIGKNGKGKSTLLNLMAGELTPQTGTIKKHPKMHMGHFAQTNIIRLSPELTIEEEIFQANHLLNRTAVKNICGTMMFSGDMSEKKISVLSGGEKSRVLLGKILAHPSNLILLDEPTNHLDMESIQSLVESLQDYPGAVVIVTHSEMILREVATKLVVFQHGDAFLFNGNYDDFLEKVGWEEESNTKTKPSQKEPSTHELKKQAAAEQKERNKVLAPLKKEIATTEAKIMEREALLQKYHTELVLASEQSDATKIRDVSRALTQTEAEIDALFDKLSDLNDKLVS